MKPINEIKGTITNDGKIDYREFYITVVDLWYSCSDTAELDSELGAFIRQVEKYHK